MKLTPLEDWIMQKTGIREKSRNALEKYQLQMLKETINYVKKNSSFYKEHLENIDADDIRSMDDFSSIPFTFPYNINSSKNDFLCVPQRDVKRIVTLRSSGTSGEEKRVYFTEDDIELTIDFFKYGMSCLTDETDKVLVLLPGNAYGSIGDLLKKALARSNIECIVEGVIKDVHNTAKCIVENNITCIVGIPIQVLYLSRACRDLFRSRIKKVLLSTDYVPDALIKELTDKCGCQVFNHYGMTEMGYGGGVECEALNGYHLREADLYFEIVDPFTGRAVENGQYGEVVFTTLTRQAMPLIRYRTGDIAAFANEACSCRTILKTMKKVLGRVDNKIFLDENYFIYQREFDERILCFEEVIDYKVIICGEGLVTIEVAIMPDVIFNTVKEKITNSIQELVNRNCENRIKLEIIQCSENKPAKITNSMVKRKICI